MTDDLKLVERLRERAVFAREEKTATAICDARHFEEAASAIERLVREVEGIAMREAATVKAAFRTQADRDRLAALVAKMREKFVGYEKLDEQISYRTRYGGDPGQAAFDRRDALWNELRALLQRAQEQTND